MNFLDIFLKLLPFTYSNHGSTGCGLLHPTQMNGGDWIITFFILLLWFVALLNGWKLRKSISTDKKMVTQLHDALKKHQGKMQTNYNEFVAELVAPTNQPTNQPIVIALARV